MRLVLRACLVLCLYQVMLPAIEGLVGGTGGDFFFTNDLERITVRAGSCIDSISTGDGHFGGSGGSAAGTLYLHQYVYSQERIIAIGGYHRDYIRSLWIQTTERRITFGTNQSGDPFRFEAPPGFYITSIHGRCGRLIDAIGVGFSRDDTYVPSTAPNWHCGNSGGRGGNLFDDSTTAYANLPMSSLQIRSSSGRIKSVQAFYRSGQIEVAGNRHGGTGGTLTTITFSAGEYITVIEGRNHGRIDGMHIRTNFGRDFYFGSTTPGSYCSYQYHAPRGYAIGHLTGRSGSEVDAIGVVLVPYASNG